MTATQHHWPAPLRTRPGPTPLTTGALLRRADWRFLLPTPPAGGFHHLVLLGGPPGLAPQLVALGVAARVSGSLPTTRVADALIVLAGASTTVRAATRCLCPGGVLYAELARWREGWLASPQRLARTLGALGLAITGCYAVRPGFEACELYLPLDVPAALAWYVATHYPAASPLQRLAEAALRVATGLRGTRFAPLVPGYAVTAVAGARGGAPSVLGHPELPEALRQPGLRPLVITAGQDGGNRATLLPFAPEATAPVAVLKVTKLPTFNARTEHEQQVLATLHATLDPDLRAAVPHPLGTVAVGRCVASIESYQPGRSLLRSSGRWGDASHAARADLARAGQWLSDFHTRGGYLSHAPWGDESYAQWLVRPLAAFEQRFGLSATEARGFRTARAWGLRLMGLPFPTVWQHRDFNVWNLFREGEALAVVDWEGAQPGPALCDLLHLVTHWHDTVRHLREHTARLQGFRRLFLEPRPNDAVVESAHSALATYRLRLGLDARFQPLLLFYLWVELALRRATQQEELGTLGPNARQGNPFLDYVALLATGAEQGWGEHLHG